VRVIQLDIDTGRRSLLDELEKIESEAQDFCEALAYEDPSLIK